KCLRLYADGGGGGGGPITARFSTSPVSPAVHVLSIATNPRVSSSSQMLPLVLGYVKSPALISLHLADDSAEKTQDQVLKNSCFGTLVTTPYCGLIPGGNGGAGLAFLSSNVRSAPKRPGDVVSTTSLRALTVNFVTFISSFCNPRMSR